ncbi:DNA repair family protein [Fonsecaea pedrosoi]|nr:DNA repair family protein [Fonsecaea pedrosoi]
MAKHTLDTYFVSSTTPNKKARKAANDSIQELADTDNNSPPRAVIGTTNHPTYPWPIPHLPVHVVSEIELLVTAQGREIRDQPHLDLVYFQPFIPRSIERDVFNFLRAELFFYRVKYTIKRFGKETLVNTPRFTTVFGIDETSRFVDGDDNDGSRSRIVEASDPSKPVRRDKYKCRPRPIPECLDLLRRVTEANTNTQYNFCLVNYYASGSDSISFHSDDERFLGPEPAIASFTLGAKRDFLMKHKPPRDGEPKLETKDIKLPLASGDMILMRGPTQSNWLHSIPKRKGGEANRGRINITLRRAMVPAGTENYYRYNVGDGGVYRWDSSKKAMLPWPSGGHGAD